MDFTSLIEAAKGLFEVGFGPFLIIIFILWLLGKLHTNEEKKDWKKLYEDEKLEKITLLDKEREEKLQAIKDRKESDDAVIKLADRLREHDVLTERTLDLNEHLLEEFMNTPRKRGSRDARVEQE